MSNLSFSGDVYFMIKLITDNLLIRKFTIKDTSIYYFNNNEAQIKKYMPDHSHSNVDGARKEVASFIENYKDMRMPLHFAITKDGILIGHIGIGDDSDICDGLHEICCGINKDYRGFGYASEAIKAFVPWCKEFFGEKKIYGSMNRENIASAKSAINAGFVLTNLKTKDKNFDVYVF
jgi:RimJ/RimL family protein N-acetyltransferase